MNIINEAFYGVYPDKELKYDCSVKYSGKFKDYNANVKIRGDRLVFNLSRRWKEVGRDIKIGLLQELFVKLFKEKKSTTQMELYSSFIKSLHKFIPKENVDLSLAESFERVNNEYFYGTVEMPNLVFGGHTTTKLGSYEFQTDTITISEALRDVPEELVDYVMYHEILHKKIQFKSSGGRSYYHTGEFKKKEKEFKNSEEIEKQIRNVIARKKGFVAGFRLKKQKKGFLDWIFG